MDALQELIASLHLKVDGLQQQLEQLSHQVSDSLAAMQGSDRAHRSLTNVGGGRYPHAQRSSLELEMEHKDVLMDVSFAESEAQNAERSLSPEVQVQRLTAQLTAAYNRIAALEEQLLSQRIH